MKNLFTLLLIFFTLNNGFSQILTPKIDYLYDLYFECDSIVNYEYGSISREEWDGLDGDLSDLGKTPTDKIVSYYKEGKLSEQFIFSYEKNEWELTARCHYTIMDSEVDISTIGYINGSELRHDETLDLDYIWLTKIAPRDVLPSDIAGKVLFDPMVAQQYKEVISNITEGRMYKNEISPVETHRIFTNIDGDTVRIEKLILHEDFMELLTENILRTTKKKRFKYSWEGDILERKFFSYSYKYNKDGFWTLLNRGGRLFSRRIY